MTRARSDFGHLVLLSIPFVFLSYLPIQFGRLAMAEMPAIVLIVGTLALVHARLTGGGVWTLAAAAALPFVAYGLKVQYAYLAALPATAFAGFAAIRLVLGTAPGRRDLLNVVLSLTFAAAFALLFAVVWILPNRELFSHVVGGQFASRSSSLANLLIAVPRNFGRILISVGALPLIGVGIVAVAEATRLIRSKQWRRKLPALRNRAALLAPTGAWLLLETHKFGLSYLPTRYFLALVIAFAVFGLAFIFTVSKPRATKARQSESRRWTPEFLSGANPNVIGALSVILALNVIWYASAIERRTYAVRDAQIEIAAMRSWNGAVVLGPWAPTIFWETEAVVVPVWSGYFNDRDILSNFSPAAIVTEPDQRDSSRAFIKDGVQLPDVPSRAFRFGRWNVNLLILDDSE